MRCARCRVFIVQIATNNFCLNSLIALQKKRKKRETIEQARKGKTILFAVRATHATNISTDEPTDLIYMFSYGKTRVSRSVGVTLSGSRIRQ